MKPLELEVLPHKFKHLRDLAGAINSRQEEIDGAKRQLQGLANSLGCNLRLQGQDLIRAKKEVEHGLWLDWLASHCPEVSPRVAQFCMKLANTKHAAHLDDCATWADCYQLVKSEAPAPAAVERPWPVVPNLRNLQILERWSGTIKNAPLEDCPASILSRYREVLLPLACVLWPEKFV